MSRRQVLLAAVAVLAVLAAIIYFPWPDRSGRVQVTGTVYLNGVPLEVVRGSKIGFGPADAAGGGYSASGAIDEQGRYRLGTFKPGDGVLPGTYRVSVIAWKKVPGWRDDITYDAPVPSAVPQRYEDAETSDITVEVTPERSQTINIKLTK
jgi:hypothetical protein